MSETRTIGQSVDKEVKKLIRWHQEHEVRTQSADKADELISGILAADTVELTMVKEEIKAKLGIDCGI